MKTVEKIRKKILKAGIDGVTVTRHNGGICLSGEVSDYETVLEAGRLAVDKKHSRGVINDLRVKGEVEKGMKVPCASDQSLDGRTPDVLVIGGGIVGCAILRALSRYEIEAMLIEKEYDVAVQQSSRNDGMIHAGIDLKPNSNKVKYNMRGNAMYDRLSAELDVPIDRCGQYVLFTAGWQRLIYPLIVARGRKNDIPLAYLGKKKMAEAIGSPGYGYGGFLCQGAGIVSPYLMTVALAENAVTNGCEVYLETAALSVENDGKRVTAVNTNRGRIYPKILINAAGVWADKIAETAGDRHFTLHPRKGEEIVLDKKARGFGKGVVGRFELKGSSGKNHTKGGGVIPTIDHNVLLGPSAYEVRDREDLSTTRAGIDAVFQKQKSSVTDLKQSDFITYFAGIRAATYEEEFVVERSPVIANLIQAAGIQSPGITAAPAIAEDVAKWVGEIFAEQNRPLAEKQNFNPYRKGIPSVQAMSKEERAELIRQNPDYGEIVCRCEEISKGEILDALRRPLASPTIDGVKRRVRAGMGRCQGGFCSPVVTALIAAECGIAPEQVTKKGGSSRLTLGRTEEGQ